MKNTRNTMALIATIALFTAMTVNLSAQGVPGAFNYQGRLLDKVGQPVTTPVTLTFSLWDAATTGTQLSGGWSDADSVTPDANAVSWINPRLVPGEVRKVVTGIPGKTGVVYTLDRETGEFLWATPTVPQNVISSIDGLTGGVTENSEVVFTGLGQEVVSCPSWGGGKNWPAGAYSPLTNTMFYPLKQTCARVLSTMDGGLAIYRLAARFELPPGIDQLGTVRAISAETGETSWLHEQRAATYALAATGGGLVFGGDGNGRFRAFDQESGDVLWEINLGSPVTGFPMASEKITRSASPSNEIPISAPCLRTSSPAASGKSAPQWSLMLTPSGSVPMAITSAPSSRKISGAMK